MEQNIDNQITDCVVICLTGRGFNSVRRLLEAKSAVIKGLFAIRQQTGSHTDKRTDCQEIVLDESEGDVALLLKELHSSMSLLLQGEFNGLQVNSLNDDWQKMRALTRMAKKYDVKGGPFVMPGEVSFTYSGLLLQDLWDDKCCIGAL